MVRKFIAKFTDKDLGTIIRQGQDYFLVSKDLLDIKNRISRRPEYLGVFLGKMKQQFQPSPALLELLAKHSSKKVFVNKKAEWLFLCGRDIFGKSITKASARNGLVLVQNERDDNLGYGKVINSLEKKDQVVIKNLLDRGSYLRDEG